MVGKVMRCHVVCKDLHAVVQKDKQVMSVSVQYCTRPPGYRHTSISIVYTKYVGTVPAVLFSSINKEASLRTYH